jgi:hypothetical protein
LLLANKADDDDDDNAKANDGATPVLAALSSDDTFYVSALRFMLTFQETRRTIRETSPA